MVNLILERFKHYYILLQTIIEFQKILIREAILVTKLCAL